MVIFSAFYQYFFAEYYYLVGAKCYCNVLCCSMPYHFILQLILFVVFKVKYFFQLYCYIYSFANITILHFHSFFHIIQLNILKRINKLFL